MNQMQRTSAIDQAIGCEKSSVFGDLQASINAAIQNLDDLAFQLLPVRDQNRSCDPANPPSNGPIPTRTPLAEMLSQVQCINSTIARVRSELQL